MQPTGLPRRDGGSGCSRTDGHHGAVSPARSRVQIRMNNSRKLRFGVIGIDHRHIYDQVKSLLDIGAECAGYWTQDVDVPTMAGFEERFPHIQRVADRRQLLEDERIQLITCAAIPTAPSAAPPSGRWLLWLWTTRFRRG